MSKIVVELTAILVLDTEQIPPVSLWPYDEMFNIEGVTLVDVAVRKIQPSEEEIN